MIGSGPAIAEIAVAYAEKLGWRVLLVASHCKTPIRHEGWEHGVHSATADPIEIARRFHIYPNANLALACGPESNVLALDVDAKDGVDGFGSLGELVAEFGQLPKTWRSRTPSGGAHFLFSYPEGLDPKNRVGLKRFGADGSRRVYPGLDVRAAGASIALPPSRKPAGSYQWDVQPMSCTLASAPDWLVGIMRSEPPPPPPRQPLRLTALDRTAKYVAAAVDGECTELSQMGPNSGRNQRLFQAAANLGEFVGAGLLPQSMAEDALERAADECGLTREDGPLAIRGTIASGMRKGMANPREVRP